jgi:hypothetical protein
MQALARHEEARGVGRRRGGLYLDFAERINLVRLRWLEGRAEAEEVTLGW